MKKKTVKKVVKRKSKGKQHPVHAQSLARIAAAIDSTPYLTPHTLSRIFMNEAKRVQSVLR